MKYKKYIGEIKYDAEERIFHGRVINIKKDIISFEGETIKKAKKDFKIAIKFYLKMKKENKETPEKPFKMNGLSSSS